MAVQTERDFIIENFSYEKLIGLSKGELIDVIYRLQDEVVWLHEFMCGVMERKVHTALYDVAARIQKGELSAEWRQPKCNKVKICLPKSMKHDIDLLLKQMRSNTRFERNIYGGSIDGSSKKYDGEEKEYEFVVSRREKKMILRGIEMLKKGCDVGIVR